MPAARTEPLTAGDPVPARHHDCLSCGKRRVRDDAAWRIDPDQAGDVTRHPRSVGREDRALIDDPAGAGVGFADLLEHLDRVRQVDLLTAQRTGKRELEQPGVRERLKERLRQLPGGLDLIGAGSDHGSEFSRGVKRRFSFGGSHWFDPTRLSEFEARNEGFPPALLKNLTASLLQTAVNVHLYSKID